MKITKIEELCDAWTHQNPKITNIAEWSFDAVAHQNFRPPEWQNVMRRRIEINENKNYQHGGIM